MIVQVVQSVFHLMVLLLLLGLLVIMGMELVVAMFGFIKTTMGLGSK